MEKIIAELKTVFPFKDTTQEGDIVLIVAEEPQLMVYALVTDIKRDVTKRDEWWHVTMHILTVPPQKVVWTLRYEQMSGMEIFSMGGEKRFVKAIDFTESRKEPQQKGAAEKGREHKKSFLKVVK